MSVRDVTGTPTAAADASLAADDCAAPAAVSAPEGWGATLAYLAAGTALGVLFMRSEVLSWYRIQEMFRFQAWHMFGIIGVAIGVAAVGRSLVRRLGLTTFAGQPALPRVEATARPSARHLLGGLVFGLGWALLGACPGPIFTLIGAGYTSYVVALAAAVAGTWLYGLAQTRLPH